MDLDRSLDTILNDKSKQRRRVKKPTTAGAKVSNGVAKKAAPAAKKTGKAAATQSIALASRTATAAAPVATKIIVHGLPSDVTEKQIREYMATEVGPVSRIELSYDKNGASKGAVTVQFAKGGEYALKAANLLNGRVVDGRGPKPSKMRVEIVQPIKEPGLAERMGLSKTASKPAKQGQAPAQAKAQPKLTGAEAEAFARAVSAATSGATLTKKEKTALRKAAAAAGAPGAGATQKKPAAGTVAAAKAVGVKTKKLAKTGPGRVKRVAKTAAELDAEMVDYFDKAK